MQVASSIKWAQAIALRVSDEWIFKNDFPEDAERLRRSIELAFSKTPEACDSLIGSGIIEEDYFEKLS